MAAIDKPDKELEVKRIAVGQLRLDPKNPRLAMRHGEKASQEDLLKEMYQKYVLEELFESLATHGYFTEEPLIAVPAEIDPRTRMQLYTVVEGNRRPQR